MRLVRRSLCPRDTSKHAAITCYGRLTVGASKEKGTIVARTRFIRLAGGGLLLAAAIEIVFTSLINARLVTTLYNLGPLQAIVSVALLTGLIALIVAQENQLGWLGYLGFGIALASALSTLVGFFGARLNGFSFLLLLISVMIPRDPQHSGLSALNYVAPGSIWLTSLCTGIGLSLFGLASLRARRIPLWGAGALLALGLLQLPFVVLFFPFAASQFAVFPTSVYSAFLNALRSIPWPLSLATPLLWGVVGVALLRYSRT